MLKTNLKILKKQIKFYKNTNLFLKILIENEYE